LPYWEACSLVCCCSFNSCPSFMWL
jgi:hypothetical protein